MASDTTYTFTGQARTGWFSYRDLATGRMLEADPGGTYNIQPLEPGLPMPPDAQWLPSASPAARAAAKAAADAQALAEAASTSETTPASVPGGDI